MTATALAVPVVSNRWSCTTLQDGVEHMEESLEDEDMDEEENQLLAQLKDRQT